MEHILEARQFDPRTLEKIFVLADSLERRQPASLKGKILASLFYEPSTRTRFSFESAMLRLGGSVISTEHAGLFSSAAKGETLEDTIRVVGNYADIIVLRHPEQGAARRAAAVTQVPVINAGDGAGEHPTQALLDLYTIHRELGRIRGITIAFAGDLKYGRTIRSLSSLLAKYEGVRMVFVSPRELRIGEDVREYLAEQRIAFEEVEDWTDVLPQVDALYQTRIQAERFPSPERFQGRYILRMRDVERMPEHAIIMHSLPRVDEIAHEVDVSPKAVYFRQAGYGLFVRMALLLFLLSK